MPSECFFFSERSPWVNFDKVMGVICSAEKRHLLFRANLSAWIHANIYRNTECSACPGITDAVLFVCGAKWQVCSGAGGRHVGWQVQDCACWFLCKIYPLHCYLMHVCLFVCVGVCVWIVCPKSRKETGRSTILPLRRLRGQNMQVLKGHCQRGRVILYRQYY